MSRRPPAEGSVFQLPDGRWAATIDLPRQPNGRRNRRKREAPTKTEALKKLRDMRREIEDYGGLGRTDRKVSDTLDDYMAGVLLPARRGQGLTAQQGAIREALGAYLGNRRTDQLNVRDCDAFLVAFAQGQASKSGRPVGRDYVGRARSFLRNAIHNDMRLGYINRNVADLAVIPEIAKEPRPRRALSIAEWRTLYGHAQRPLQLAVDLSGRHGLRPQETRSVRWPEIDFARHTLSVVTQFDSFDEFVDPKTVDSTRTIELHPETVDALDEWRTEQGLIRQRAGRRWAERDLVIATKWGTAIDKDNYKRSVETLCKQAAVPAITPYELRHTAITHQVEAAGSAAPVADWAGTSERMIWKHYRHKLRDVVQLPPPTY